ncbi:MAG TPA: MFS transporter [Woeseiaceae bacterium]|nr:MFS transporter [Woeseiaceae bacterium]
MSADSHTRSSAAPSNIRWRILAVLVVVSFVSYLLRGNLSIAAPTMKADLDLTEIQWGWVMSAFPLGYALLQFPGGCWADRHGPRKVLTAIVLAWGVLIALTALVPGREAAPLAVVIGALLLVQFLVGVVHAPVFPAVVGATQRWFPVGGWGLPNGLSSSGLTLGLAATASLLPWLIGNHGWRASFLMLAPIAIGAAALWWWYGRDRPAEHPAVNAAEVALITADHAPDPGGLCGTPAWRRVLKNRDALFMMLSYASMNFVFYVVFSWGFYYLVTIRNFAEQEAGFLTSAQWIGGAAGAALGGWLCDRLCRRLGLRWGCRWPVIIGCGVSAVLLLGVAAHPDPYAAAVMLGLCFFFNQATEGAFAANAAAVGGRHAGAAYGLMNTGANLMGFVNALLLSAVAATLGWAVAISMGAVFAGLSVLFILLARADVQVDQSD